MDPLSPLLNVMTKAKKKQSKVLDPHPSFQYFLDPRLCVNHYCILIVYVICSSTIQYDLVTHVLKKIENIGRVPLLSDNALTLLHIFSGIQAGRTTFKTCKISGSSGCSINFPASILTLILCNILLLLVV